MNLLLIIGIIIIVVLVIALVFHFIKMALKSFGIIILILIAIFAVLGVLTYFDAIDFQESFGVSDNLYLLREDDAILAGFIANAQDPEGAELLDSNTLSDYEKKLQDENYEEVLGENYKLFIIEMEVLEESVLKSLKFRGYNLSKELGISILKSNTPRDDLAQYIATENGVPKEIVLQTFDDNNITSDAQMKGALFALFREKQFTEGRGLRGMISNIKNSKIVVYPKKVLFTMIRLIPDSWVDKLVEINEGG
ncbi:MAG: hypothetical protein ABIE94_02160 [archaeon]